MDTSVWVDHFRRPNASLTQRLEADQVWTHPLVIGELACGNLSPRRETLLRLSRLHHARVVDHGEVLQFVEEHGLHGRGLGWIDIHLLASAYVGQLPIWAFDKRLAAAARGLRLDAPWSLH